MIKKIVKVFLGLVVVLGIISFVIPSSDGDGENGSEIADAEEVIQNENDSDTGTSELQEPEADEEDQAEEDATIPREHRNALRAAENYLLLMPFSKAGLFEQLTSSYGDDYPEEAAQYAVDNVETDWNANALKAAENYLDLMPMFDSELYDQLVSEYGDKYTPEQAQYAIDNLAD